MKTAVIFSVTIFSDSLVPSMDEWLNVFEQKFKDCDFYFGINHGTNPAVLEKIKNSSLNKSITVSPQELYATSDASGYQAALFDLKESNKEYDCYWFGHTKGGVNPRADRRRYYITEFFSKREQIEREILENDVGVYGLHAVHKSANGVTEWKNYPRSSDHGGIPLVENVSVDGLLHEHVNISFVETFFVMDGKPINWFVKNAKNEWFFSKIQDRWYFETVFPWLASRYGMSTYLKNQTDFLTPSITLPQIQIAKKI